MFQNQADFIAFHVDVIFSCAQSLQSFRRAAQHKDFPAVSSVTVPLVNVLCIARVNGISHALSFRRALCLEGSGVFFCTAQVVHRFFSVGKVFVLQNSALVLGQALGLQGRPVVGVKGQHFLGPADDAAQHLLHPVHHGADGSGPAAVLLGLPALELYPALEIGFIGENAPPGIAHQLLGSFLIGQILLGIVGHLLPDHLVHGLKAAAPGQIQQGMVLQSLCSLAVQCVVPVVVLVQHRAERILYTVPKEDPGRLRVHIGPHPAVCLSRTVLQHVFQNRRGTGCRRVQLDHLAASVVRVAQGSLVDGLTPARQALFRQSAAQLALGPPGICRIPAVGVGDLQRVPALEVAQHIVHVGRHATAGARQLQRLVKGLHVLHLAQPVQSGCCRRIAVTVHAFRLFPADLLRRLFAHLPAPQHLLRPGLLLALRPRCFHAVGLPHLAVAAVHPVKGAFFHRDRLHHNLLVRSILRSQLNVSRPAKGPHTRGAVSAYALTKGFCTVRCCFRGAFHHFPSVLNSILLAALCRHFPQHPPGSRSRARQLHPIGFLKSRAVCLVSGLRGEQPDGLACQAVTGRRFCKRLHSQVVRYRCSTRTAILSRRALLYTLR